MRRKIIAGNWKMHKTCAETVAYIEEFAPLVAGVSNLDIVLCPPYTALYNAAQALGGTEIALAAQDVFWKGHGAYTGQVAPAMIAELGCRYAVVGHSEKRGRFGVAEADFDAGILGYFGDTDETVNRKARAALAAGIVPIICVGETIAERRAGETDGVIASQVAGALAGIAPEVVGGMVMAYEPVWAIGTGEVCEACEADRVCGLIRQRIAWIAGEEPADRVRVQYGGSVKPDNAAELLRQPQIDGALVGGASLQPAHFAAIVRAV